MLEIKKVVDLFERINISLNRIPKSFNKTPDLESESLLVEVKERDPNLNGRDAIIGNLTDGLKGAARQFREYDPEYKKMHIICLFIDFYDLDEIRNDVYTVYTGKFSKDCNERIYQSSWKLSDKYQNLIDGILWFKNYKFQFAWMPKKEESIIKNLCMFQERE